MPPATMEFRVLFRDDAMLLGACSNLLVTDLRGAFRREHLTELARAYQATSRSYPQGLLALTLLNANVPIGDSEIRGEASRMMESLSSVLRHISVVLEGSGIWAGTMRTVLRGLSVVAKTPYAMKVHDDLPTAARALVPLLTELTGQRATELDLLEALQRFRALQTTPPSRHR